MIDPDTKDWTWVLEKACPECGFDASRCSDAGVAGLVRENAGVWQELLDDGAIHVGPPYPSTWSTLEYACHVRDVYLRYGTRIESMLTRDDPLFENWDQDVATLLEGVVGEEWERRGRRSDGASFHIGSIARYMIHDPIHHVWDVRRQTSEPDAC